LPSTGSAASAATFCAPSRERPQDIEVVAINDLGPVETNAHLLRYDSVHGRFRAR
jgi:glyceraldehyde-3-phosphate dehydrogenase/erythrose-4-phosphate dehydrogenase